jgi:hypothetical protein
MKITKPDGSAELVSPQRVPDGEPAPSSWNLLDSAGELVPEPQPPGSSEKPKPRRIRWKEDENGNVHVEAKEHPGDWYMSTKYPEWYTQTKHPSPPDQGNPTGHECYVEAARDYRRPYRDRCRYINADAYATSRLQLE